MKPILTLLAPILLISLTVQASPTLPYSPEYKAKIEATFLKNGRFSEETSKNFIKLIKRKKKFLASNTYQNELYEDTIEKGKKLDKAAKQKAKADRTDTTTYLTLKEIDKKLKLMATTTDEATLYQLGSEALTLEFATRDMTDDVTLMRYPGHIRRMISDMDLPVKPGQESPLQFGNILPKVLESLKETYPVSLFTVKKAPTINDEARNLWNPQTQKYYSPEELAKVQDISALNPPDKTYFWEKTNIEKVNVAQKYLSGDFPLYRGLDILKLDDGAVVTLKRVQLTQSKPKFVVTAMKNGKKYDIKLKFGAEVHSDPTANSLMVALGYNADITYPIKNVKVYVGRNKLDSVKKQWIEYFDHQKIFTYHPYRATIKEEGRDEGGDYMVFHEALVELKPTGVKRLGRWAYSDGPGASFRDARAMLAFWALLNNADAKDSENNKVFLKEQPDGSRQMIMAAHDLGHSFGLVLAERPYAYPADVIETSWWSRAFGASRGRIELNYFNLQPCGLTETATWNDLAWGARLFARLSRQQIVDAVKLGRWNLPGEESILIEKLINRRNQFVTVFELDKKYSDIAHIPSIYDDRKKAEEFENQQKQKDFAIRSQPNYFTPFQFENHWAGVFAPVARLLKDEAINITCGALGAISDIKVINNLEVGPGFIIPEVTIALDCGSAKPNFNSEFADNEDYNRPGYLATSKADDQVIVQQKLSIGIRLGYGFWIFGESGYKMDFVLAFPESSVNQANTKHRFYLKDILLNNPKRDDWPSRYMLVRKSDVFFGARARSDINASGAPVGFDISDDWFTTHKSVIDYRTEKPQIMIGKSDYNSIGGRVFISTPIFNIPFIKVEQRNGGVEGALWQLDPQKLTTNEGRNFMTKASLVGDHSSVKDFSEKRNDITAKFSRDEESLLGLLFGVKRASLQEDVELKDSSGKLLDKSYQARRYYDSYWKILGIGESFEARSNAYLGYDVKSNQPKSPVIKVRYALNDKRAHNKNLDNFYNYLNQFTAMPKGFRAQDWETDGFIDPSSAGLWTNWYAVAKLEYYEEALQRVLGVNPENFKKRIEHYLTLERVKEEVAARQLAKPSKQDLERMYQENLVTFRQITDYGTRPDRMDAQLHKRHLRELTMMYGTNAFLQSLRKAQKAGKTVRDKKVLYHLNYALLIAGYSVDEGSKIVLLSVLHDMIDADKLLKSGAMYVEGRMTKPFEDQMKIVESMPILGFAGRRAKFDKLEFIADPWDAVELWHSLPLNK